MPNTSDSSFRLAHLALTVFVFLMSASYSALLTAHMVSVPQELDIDSLEELASSDVAVLVGLINRR